MRAPSMGLNTAQRSAQYVQYSNCRHARREPVGGNIRPTKRFLTLKLAT